MMKTKSLEYLNDLILRYPDLSDCKNAIAQSVDLISAPLNAEASFCYVEMGEVLQIVSIL